MATAFRTDVDTLAAAYLKNRVNNNIAPLGASFAPAYTNTTYLAEFSKDPYESHPSLIIPLEQIMSGDQLRRIIIELGKVYAPIGRGHYGILTTTATSSRYDFAGSSHFYFNSNAPGASDHASANYVRVEDAVNQHVLNGDIKQATIMNMYDAVWNVINNNKENIDVDLTVCHSSCHVSCHGSRGRR